MEGGTPQKKNRQPFVLRARFFRAFFARIRGFPAKIDHNLRCGRGVFFALFRAPPRGFPPKCWRPHAPRRGGRRFFLRTRPEGAVAAFPPRAPRRGFGFRKWAARVHGSSTERAVRNDALRSSPAPREERTRPPCVGALRVRSDARSGRRADAGTRKVGPSSPSSRPQRSRRSAVCASALQCASPEKRGNGWMGVEFVVSVPRVADKVHYGPSHSGIPRSPSFCSFGFCGVRSERVPPDGVRFLFGPLQKKRRKKSAHACFFAMSR